MAYMQTYTTLSTEKAAYMHTMYRLAAAHLESDKQEKKII